MASDASVVQARPMWWPFMRDTQPHSLYRTGCLLKCFSRPPMMCRQEWHDSVYAQSSTTLAISTRLPRPKPKPSVPQNARIASHVFSTEIRNAAKNAYRWAFWKSNGKRVSPEYVLWPSGTAHAGGDAQNAR